MQIAEVKDRVEHVLSHSFGRGDNLKDFAGKLSIHPELVDPYVSETTLYNKCSRFSEELDKGLREAGLRTKICISNLAYDVADHLYLVDFDVPEEDVLIDATLGQYLQGHNHTFIGTRGELRELVLGHTPGIGLVPSLTYAWGKSLGMFFEGTWGSSSQTWEAFLQRTTLARMAQVFRSHALSL